YHLVAKATVELNVEGEADLPVRLYKQAIYFNYEKYTEYFKIVVSDKPFEIYTLTLPTLPEPPLPGVERERYKRSKGGIGRTKSLEGWFVTSVRIVNANPAFNKLSSAILKA